MDERPTRALVLSEGGGRGAYECGVFKCDVSHDLIDLGYDDAREQMGAE